MSLSHTSDRTFRQDVLDCSVPVLVDFWAEWCGPCRIIGPILEEVHKDLGLKVKIVKINIDQNPEVPAQFGVRSIPTLTLFKDGQAISTKVGVIPKAKIVEWLLASI